MDLTTGLTSFYDNMLHAAPAPVSNAMRSAAKDHEDTFNWNAAVKVGDALPSFELPDGSSKYWTKDELLAKGPILIVFDRGGWCPLCNMALRAFQQYVHLFQEKGVTLMAVSPDPPDVSGARKVKMELDLDFLLLSDPANDLARALGIINQQPETLRPVLSTMNGSYSDSTTSMDVPVPATILVDGMGIVNQASVNLRIQQRLDPATALEWIEGLKTSKSNLPRSERTGPRMPDRATSESWYGRRQ